MNTQKSRISKVSFISFVLLLFTMSVNSAYGQGGKIDLSKAVIVYSAAQPRQANAAEFLQHEVELRTGIKLAVSESMPSDAVPAIVLGTVGTFPVSYKLPLGLTVPAKAEGYAVWADSSVRSAPTVYLLGRDDRGALFAAGRLIRLLYLSADYITLADDVMLGTAPADAIRAQQIICSTQSKDRFVHWRDETQKKQHILDMVMFGTNGFEARPAEDVDELLEELGIDLYLVVSCQKIIDYNELSDDEIRKLYTDIVGVDHMTTYGGDASGSRPPQEVFPKMERVLPLILESHPGAKWWYSNQCLDAHAVDYDDYIFNYFNTNKPGWLYGMVYGPWTKRGITEIRADLPAQYELRHYPEICHVRWCQFPVPQWDLALAQVWPRNQSIYTMPGMMKQVHNATRRDTVGFLPYNHTGCYNDLNKFAWSASGWDPDIKVEDILYDYGRAFFAYQFKQFPDGSGRTDVPRDIMIDAGARAVARGLMLLEENWTGALAENKSAEEALKQWKMIAKCMGGVGNNWRLEMFLYKAFIDAQIKQKYDAEMKYQKQAYEALTATESRSRRSPDAAKLVENARAELAKIDTEFQSKEAFKQELLSWGLSDNFGDLDAILDNLYLPLSDRKWLEKQLDAAASVADIRKIVNYEDAGPGGFYDNLGVRGRQPHLVRPKSWQQDPGFVYSNIDWVDHSPGSDKRHSQLTHAVARYSTPLVMRWDELDQAASYRIKVVYSGPFGPEFTCKTDEGILVHGVRGNTGTEPVEYAIPPAATRDGVLELIWELKNEVRGVSVTEIWLVKD